MQPLKSFCHQLTRTNKLKMMINRIILSGIVIFLSACQFSVAQNKIAEINNEFSDVSKVSVRCSFVDIYADNGDKLTANGLIEGSGEKGDYDFKTSIENNVLYIELKVNRTKTWGSYKISKAYLKLKIPKNVELSVANSSGDVNVNNLATSKSLIKTSSGDINLKNTYCNLTVYTTSGDISINQLTGDSRITSTSGDQQIADVKGNLYCTASSGDLKISDFDGDLDIKRSSGDVILSNGKGVINFNASSGNLYGKDIQITNDCNFKSTSGDIKMYLKNDIDQVGFNLSTTSGDLTIGDESAEGNWTIKRGNLKIKSITTSGNQTFK